MKENLKFQWENQANRLLDDEVFAKSFAEVILGDVLQENVAVEQVCVHLEEDKMTERTVVVLDANIAGQPHNHNMEIYLYQHDEMQMHHKGFQFQYYCVEAPAILLDSGSTRLNLTVREDIMEWWKTTVIKEHYEK